MRLIPDGKFFGETVRKIQTANFGLSETFYPAFSRLPLHTHESPYFGFVLDGTYVETADRCRRVRNSQSLVYHPAGEQHEQLFESCAVRLFRIEIGSQYCSELQECDLRLNHSGGSVQDGDISILVRRIYRELDIADDASALISEGLILELIGTLRRQSPPPIGRNRRPPRWLRGVFDLINERFSEPLTLSALAREANVHPVTLSREFRRCYGKTLGCLVRQKRVEFARGEIIKGEISLAEIALLAGFYDQSHFTKKFKSFTGITPRQFQSRQKN